jgi:hypothetical protein
MLFIILIQTQLQVVGYGHDRKLNKLENIYSRNKG